jgi:cytochrome P450
LAYGVDVISSVRARKYRYPPGPKPLPIIGNIHQLPQGQLGKWAQGLAKEYGEMFTIRLGGQTWVFVNSSRVVKDLLEKRAAVFPLLPVADAVDL